MTRGREPLRPLERVRRFLFGRLMRPGGGKRLMSRVLSPELTAEVPWSHGDRELIRLKGDYHAHWRTVGGGHKVYSYFDTYERVFAPFRGRSLRVLEIGVFRGASLRAWHSYLGEGATVVGIDIDETCRQFDAPQSGVHVRIGDAGDARFLEAVAAEFGPFDVIIDDGSHYTHHQLLGFNTLFVRHLRPSGIYFIEDTCTSAWPRYRTSAATAFDLAKALVDAINGFYARYDYGDYAAASYRDSYSVPLVTRLVRELRVFDSAIAICKAEEDYFPPMVFRSEDEAAAAHH